MYRTRYTRWDGTQTLRLRADRVFEKLAEFLTLSDDLAQAIDWLARQGVEWDDTRIAGLDELLEQLREEMRKRYRDVNLDHALDPVREAIERIREREEPPAAEDPARPADSPPSRLSEAIERLQNRPRGDSSSEPALDELAEKLDDVRDLEDFARRYGDLFQGKRSLDFDEAVDLMREMERLKKLEEELFSGNLKSIELEDVRELLGEEAWRNVRALQQVMEVVAESGYVMTQGGRQRLSPKGVRKIGELALRDIYKALLGDRIGTHALDKRGTVELRMDRTRKYAFGDPLHLDLVGTLKKALLRGVGTPLAIGPEDFEVYETDATTTAATVLLLDMSWSMSWEGRFAAAKKVAMALESLVRTKYPRDYLGIVGFFTRAVELKLKDLPESSWNMGDPFTNLQDGLRLALELLSRHPSRNQHMIVITDGQPTAYFSKGRLYCEWPLSFGGISLRAAAETLKEVERVTRRGVTINTFMLDDSPALRSFVEQMTRINKGRALFTRPDHLGEYLLVDYLAGRKKRANP